MYEICGHTLQAGDIINQFWNMLRDELPENLGLRFNPHTRIFQYSDLDNPDSNITTLPLYGVMVAGAVLYLIKYHENLKIWIGEDISLTPITEFAEIRSVLKEVLTERKQLLQDLQNPIFQRKKARELLLDMFPYEPGKEITIDLYEKSNDFLLTVPHLDYRRSLDITGLAFAGVICEFIPVRILRYIRELSKLAGINEDINTVMINVCGRVK